jgi:hypothetical protein
MAQQRFLARIERWLESDATQDLLATKDIYRVHVGADERHYAYQAHSPPDEGVEGVRFSFLSPRQTFCFNALLRVEGGRVVLKVATSRGGKAVRWVWRGICCRQQLLHILTERVYVSMMEGPEGAPPATPNPAIRTPSQ